MSDEQVPWAPTYNHGPDCKTCERSTIDRMASLLRRLEWAGDVHGDAACPCCLARKDIDLPGVPGKYEFEAAGNHRPDCELAALLRDLPCLQRPEDAKDRADRARASLADLVASIL